MKVIWLMYRLNSSPWLSDFFNHILRIIQYTVCSFAENTVERLPQGREKTALRSKAVFFSPGPWDPQDVQYAVPAQSHRIQLVKDLMIS